MAKVPAIVDSSRSHRAADTEPSVPEATAVPAWLAARRSRVRMVRDDEIEVEGDDASPLDVPPLSNANPADAVPERVAAAPQRDSSLPRAGVEFPRIEAEGLESSRLRSRKTIWQRVNDSAVPGAPMWVLIGAWFSQAVQQYGSAMIGASVSVATHAVLIVSLAVLVIADQSENLSLNIFGTMGTPNETELADVNLDSALQVNPGKDAATLQFPDFTQVTTENAIGFDPGESLRGTLNGTGSGEGTGGDGDAMPVPTVNVPGYAVTKGSFSAWTEPRDPDPKKQYFIVIQVRLPANVKKYRASDLTGMVVGTDLYKQVIKFRSTEEFPIKEGAVQVRIPVPGAAKLVRDTIRIESRLLREKQTIQIEF